jgi:hypothetical protein
MVRRYWADLSSDNYEFKILTKEDDEFYCSFRMKPINGIPPQLTVGSVYKLNDNRSVKVIQCEIENSSFYGTKVTGRCVLQLLSGLQLSYTPVLYS